MNYKTRVTLAIVGILMCVFWVLPNIVNVDGIKWWPSKAKLNYGLDIQGGLHLVMGVDVDGVITESTNRMILNLKEELAKTGDTIKDVTATDATRGEVLIQTTGDHKKVEALLAEKYPTQLQVVEANESGVRARYYDSYINDYKEKVIQQAIETIRNRIDEFGVAEPSISQQGANRILVQLPGMADAERAKALINTTAKLDFMMVSTELDPGALQKLITDAEKAGNYSMATTKYSEYVTRLNKDIAAKLPAKTVVFFEKAPNAQKLENGAVPHLLKTDTGLGGKDLENAFVSYGQYGEPEVSLRFSPTGATKFADITGANVGHQMAIVLDRVVKSAPNLKDRITGGSAVITLGGGRDRQGQMDESKMISTSLRAGALPATLEQLEERRVGPSLGADAISKAKIGAYLGAFLIVLFMIGYYRSMGVVATICLGINILGVFALLTTLGATLTLPGIAGIALTVGVAVDANVLINERIRDELRHGGSDKVAIQEGYRRAMSAILDSNFTTATVALVMLYFGTGPVRGFAVTLLVGIVTTLFANVFVSKVLVDTLIQKFKMQKLSV